MGNSPVTCDVEQCAPFSDADTQFDVAALATARGDTAVAAVRWDGVLEAEAQAASLWERAGQAPAGSPLLRIPLGVQACAARREAEDSPVHQEATPAGLTGLRLSGATVSHREPAAGMAPAGCAKRAAAADSSAAARSEEGLRKLTLQFGLPSTDVAVVDMRTARRGRQPPAQVSPLRFPLSTLSSRTSEEASSHAASRRQGEDDEDRVSQANTIASSAGTDRQVARTLLQSSLPLRLDEVKGGPRSRVPITLEDNARQISDDSMSTGSSPDNCGEADEVRKQHLKLPLAKLHSSPGDGGKEPWCEGKEDSCFTNSTHAPEVDDLSAARKHRELEIYKGVRDDRDAQERVRRFLQQHGFRGVCDKRQRLMSYVYPLHLAVTQRDPVIIKALLKARADASQTDSTGRTPYQLAKAKDDGFGSHDLVMRALSEQAALASRSHTPVRSRAQTPVGCRGLSPAPSQAMMRSRSQGLR